MKGLTTHILDLMSGTPAANVRVELFYQDQASSGEMEHIAMRITNNDGRLDEPFLNQGSLKKGNYKFVFFIGDYFREKAVNLPEPSFLEEVAVQFGVADPSLPYHVPLLVSPWGYQVYRGS